MVKDEIQGMKKDEKRQRERERQRQWQGQWQWQRERDSQKQKLWEESEWIGKCHKYDLERDEK
jgi:hypothetical protein